MKNNKILIKKNNLFNNKLNTQNKIENNYLINKKNNLLVYFISFLLIFALIFGMSFSSKFAYADSDISEVNYTEKINTYLNDYYVSIESSVKNRTAGGVGEKFMANTLASYLEANNFQKINEMETYLQEFKISGGKSNNVIGVIDKSASKYVILGAHYDAVYTAGKSYGYSDNMSGVVASMITAEALKEQTDYNVILAFFGAEEIGCKGSTYFAKNLPAEIRDNTLLYVNFDSVGAGDYLYYYHTDFPTKYGNSIDKFYKNSTLKKYANELYATSSKLGMNYSNLALNSDNSSFIKQAVNSLSFFAGNLQTGNGLGYFETKNHAKIMHNTDTKSTINAVFGDSFVSNINSIINVSTSLLLNDTFNETNFASGQIKTFLYSDWILKGSGVVLVGVLFGGYFIYYYGIKYRKNKK